MIQQIQFRYYSILLVVMFSLPLLGQDATFPANQRTLEAAIFHHDSLFWAAYNSCDLPGMETALAEDLEFYHDKGGLTETANRLMEMIRGGLCGAEQARVRREAVPGTIAVFPISDYGAIMTGEHLFYVQAADGKESLEEIAKFTHLWRFTDGVWKMSRVLSYDHQAAPQQARLRAITLSAKELQQYAGKYTSGQEGQVTLRVNEQGLLLTSNGGMQATLYPSGDHVFFMRERNLQFRFTDWVDEQPQAMQVLKDGDEIDLAKRME